MTRIWPRHHIWMRIVSGKLVYNTCSTSFTNNAHNWTLTKLVLCGFSWPSRSCGTAHRFREPFSKERMYGLYGTFQIARTSNYQTLGWKTVIQSPRISGSPQVFQLWSLLGGTPFFGVGCEHTKDGQQFCFFFHSSNRERVSFDYMWWIYVNILYYTSSLHWYRIKHCLGMVTLLLFFVLISLVSQLFPRTIHHRESTWIYGAHQYSTMTYHGHKILFCDRPLP